jgi:signal peptidase I
MQQPPTPTSQTLNYAVPPNRDTRWGKGFLAVCGSLIFWGIGHAIAGRPRRGLVWFGMSLLFGAVELIAITRPSLFPLLLVLVPLHIVIFLAMIVDAFITGRKSDRPMLAAPGWRYIAGVGLLAVAFLVSRASGRVMWSLAARAGANVFGITSQGMRPTILPGDKIMTHRTSAIRRWDMVVFYPPAQKGIFTQRIVGLPGEKVEIVANQVRINDVAITPPSGFGPYLSKTAYGPRTGCEGHPITLGPNEYFSLGDNSPQAYDGRYWPDAAPGHQLGAIPAESIVGRVTAIYYPLKRIRQIR